MKYFYYTIWFNKFNNKLNKIKVIPNVAVYKVNPYLLVFPESLENEIIKDEKVKDNLITHFKSLNAIRVLEAYRKENLGYVYRLESACIGYVKSLLGNSNFNKIQNIGIDHFMEDMRLESYARSSIKISPDLTSEVVCGDSDDDTPSFLKNLKFKRYDRHYLENTELHNIYLRKFIPLKLDDGYPIEFRCVFKNGKLISICNYYIQRVMKNYDEYSNNLIKLIQEEIEPLMTESIVLDFALAEDESYYFIDSNPCLTTNLSDPCAFRNRYKELKNHFHNYDGTTILSANDKIDL